MASGNTSQASGRLKAWGLAAGGVTAVFFAGYGLGVAEPARLGWLASLIREWRAPAPYPSPAFAYLPGAADVVMLGDSITAATQWHELLPGVKVINRGAAGESTQEVAARLDEVLRRQPRKVFLMVGINDVRAGRKEEDILRDYRRIVRRLAGAGAEVYVQSILLLGRGAQGRQLNPAVTSLNTKLKELCRETGARYVDLLPRLCPAGELASEFTPDGLHLNGPGYLAWAGEVREYAR